MSLVNPSGWESRTMGEADLDYILSESGRSGIKAMSPQHMSRVAGLSRLIREAQHDDRQLFRLKEVMSTSDFPILFGDVLDRQVYGIYMDWVPTWPNYARRAVVRDFRQVRRITLDGLSERWYPDFAVPELTASKHANTLDEGQYTYSVSVYEHAYDINWRMLVNDDLDAFARLPLLIAQGARRTEEFFATSLFVDANGPHASLFTAGNKNIVNQTNGASVNNPPLDIQGLQDAMTVLHNQVDPVSGEPIMVDMMTLVVPPALEVVAKNIMFATTIRAGGYGAAAAGGGSADQAIETVNWMSGKLKLSVNPYIRTVASSANGDTSWFLFADPNSNRPALEVGFLRGYEVPQIYQRVPDMMRIGGGVDPMAGSFDSGSVSFKGRLVLGGARVSGQMCVGSNGSSS